MQMPPLGSVFDGRYQVESVLGEGGFALVFRAFDQATSSFVALKVLRPEDGIRYTPDTRRRFNREVSILDRLKHPHIVDKLSAGESADGTLFVVFDLLQGRDLSEVLNEMGPLSPTIVTSLLRQILSALQAAHDLNLLHRDLKPHNIRVIDDGTGHLFAKLLDFGIARSSDDSHPAITATGELIGTPRYMSPEQLRGVPLDPRSDLYSLGLVVFELLAGREALAGNLIQHQLGRLTDDYRLSVAELERANPRLLDVLQKMIARNPAERFQTAGEVLAALDALGPAGGFVQALPTDFERRFSVDQSIAPGSTVAQGPHATPAANPLAPPRPQHPPQLQPEDHSRPRRVAGGFVALSVTGLLIATGYAGYRTTRPPETVNVREALPQPNHATLPAFVKAAENPDVGVSLDADHADQGGGTDWSRPGAVPSEGCGITDRPSIPTYLPKGYRAHRSQPLPLVIMLAHPAVDDAELRRQTGLSRLAETEHLILIRPEAPFRSPTRRGWGEPEADIRSVLRAVEKTKLNFCVDLTRIFAFGHGDGGRAAASLTGETWVTAVATTGWSFRIKKTGEPDVLFQSFADRPVPFLWITPKGSHLIPMADVGSCEDKRKYVDRATVVEMWKGRNGCKGGPRPSDFGDACQTFNCDTKLTVCNFDGGIPWPKFVWLSGPPDDCASEPPSKLADASIIVDFFLAAKPLKTE